MGLKLFGVLVSALLLTGCVTKNNNEELAAKTENQPEIPNKAPRGPNLNISLKELYSKRFLAASEAADYLKDRAKAGALKKQDLIEFRKVLQEMQGIALLSKEFFENEVRSPWSWEDVNKTKAYEFSYAGPIYVVDLSVNFFAIQNGPSSFITTSVNSANTECDFVYRLPGDTQDREILTIINPAPAFLPGEVFEKGHCKAELNLTVSGLVPRSVEIDRVSGDIFQATSSIC